MTSEKRPPHGPAGGWPGELESRALRKAQTRIHIRRIAQQSFADRSFETVTVADVAAAAAVSVQTVFNHFDTKEELFFDGRTDWVDAPARAVRSRGPGVCPLTALRAHLVESVWDSVHLEATPEGRSYTAAVNASPALQSQENALFMEAERRLRDALAEARPQGSPMDSSMAGAAGADVGDALAAATWLAVVRGAVVVHRPLIGDEANRASAAAALVERILRGLEGQLHATFCPAACCTPDAAVRRRPRDGTVLPD